MVKSPLPVEKLSYEQALKELEEIITRLEDESPALEEAMTLFERGQSLMARCSGLLDQAELKVKQLTGKDITGEGEENEPEV
jgi:exodeoxyribonuclease VII small subunit